MAAAPRANPDDFFSAPQWRELTARSRWRGLVCVLHAWGVIGLAMLMGVLWPVTIPLAVLVIGARQLGLQILMHDAAHGLLHANRRVNDAVAYWLCSSALTVYRPYHLQHHRYVQQAEDPDLVLSAPFPISRASLLRKAVRDLTGQTFFKQRLAPLLQDLRARWRKGAWGGKLIADLTTAPVSPSTDKINAPADAQLSPDLAASGWRFLIANGLGFAVFAAFGFWWVWLLMWLLPMATWLPLISRLRNIAEHALVQVNQPDPLRQARTTRASWVERSLLAPYWVNYHCEHHLFTQVPCWNLPRAHALLQAQGTTARMEVQPGYAAVMRLAAPR